MPTTPLTDAINALTTYSNTVTGASDTTLSDAVATLAVGYGGGGVDFMGKAHEYEVTGDGTASLSVSFGATFTWAPQFIAFIAEEPYLVPESGNSVLSGTAFKGLARGSTATASTIIPVNTIASDSSKTYWSSWGSASLTTNDATINVTREAAGVFQNGQKYKVLVVETTDFIR